MKTFGKITCLLLFIVLSNNVLGQEKPDHTYKPLKVNLSPDGKKYVRLIMWHQLWLQRDFKNSNNLSASIRRSRFLAFSQISPRFLILTHFGLNSLSGANTTANPNTQQDNQRSMLFLHDAWAEFAAVPKKLHIGTGLHYWNGMSRLSNQSTLNMMTLDNPGQGRGDARLFPWSSITTSNQFARHIGIYAKGSLGKFSYRVSANNARINQGTLDPNVYSYQVDGTENNWLFTGYFKYDLLDKESDKLPYYVGTYLGKKKVLSIGAGFYNHPGALAKGNELSNVTRANVSKFAADVFYDAPVGSNGAALNVLAAYYNYNYGDDDSFANGGLVPANGNIVYGQVGYLLPLNIKGHRFMPYASYSFQDLKHTPNNSREVSVGLNWFINGHFAKITTEYVNGIKGTTGATATDVLRIQTHIFL
jgi:hypothetical protein